MPVSAFCQSVDSASASACAQSASFLAPFSAQACLSEVRSVLRRVKKVSQAVRNRRASSAT
jgi:hypothetical protein